MLDARHMNEMLNTYSTLGKALHISEITVPSYNSSASMLDLQTKVVENLYRLWFAHPSVSSIVWWNLADGFAFSNQNQNEDYYAGGLLTHDFAKKPSYEVLEELICHEWNTQTVARCDSAGVAAFCGFFGNYELKVEAEHGTVVKTISLPRGTTDITLTV
jgi:ABC-type transporter Mla MlaB component